MGRRGIQGDERTSPRSYVYTYVHNDNTFILLGTKGQK